jgi:hypothetical protein
MTLERVMKYWLLRDEWFLFIITWCRKRSSYIWFVLGFHLTTVVSMLSTTTVDDDDNDMIANTQRSTGGSGREIGDDTNIQTVWAQQKREKDERERERATGKERADETQHIFTCIKWNARQMKDGSQHRHFHSLLPEGGGKSNGVYFFKALLLHHPPCKHDCIRSSPNVHDTTHST